MPLLCVSSVDVLPIIIALYTIIVYYLFICTSHQTEPPLKINNVVLFLFVFPIPSKMLVV